MPRLDPLFVGYFVVHADTPDASEHLAEEILERFRQELHIPLIVS